MCKHDLYATATTGRLVEEVTNLNIHKFLAGHLGVQRLCSQVEQNQIDLIIFIRDAQTPKLHDHVNNIFRLCDMIIFRLPRILPQQSF